VSIVAWPASEVPTLATGSGNGPRRKRSSAGDEDHVRSWLQTARVGRGLFVYEPDEEIAQGRLDMSGREPAHR
jgi:hypothetical protein